MSFPNDVESLQYDLCGMNVFRAILYADSMSCVCEMPLHIVSRIMPVESN